MRGKLDDSSSTAAKGVHNVEGAQALVTVSGDERRAPEGFDPSEWVARERDGLPPPAVVVGARRTARGIPVVQTCNATGEE